MNRRSTLNRIANLEVKIRGVDLRLQGCLLGCTFWAVYSFVFGVCLLFIPIFVAPHSVFLVLGIGLIVPLVFHVAATCYLQSLWWGRYRELHPEFHKGRGNPVTALAPLSVMAFIGGYLIYMYFER